MNEKIQFVVVIDRMSVDSRMSSNRGDYTYGRTIAVQNGVPVAVRYFSSADFEYCPHVGAFESCNESCWDGRVFATLEDADGWQNGTPLEPELLGVAEFQLAEGYFAKIKQK